MTDIKKFIFIQGNCTSGNSAVTDWLKDNETNNSKVFTGDFEELRLTGSFIDIFFGKNLDTIRSKHLRNIILNTLRCQAKNILILLKIKSGPYCSFQIRNSIKRSLALFIILVLLKKYSNCKNLILYCARCRLNSLSCKPIIVLNNPFFLCDDDLDFLNKLNLDFRIICTHRNYISQFNDWKNLNFSICPDRYYSFSSPDKLETFYNQQTLHYRSRYFRLKRNQMQDIEYEKFIKSTTYRKRLYSLIYSFSLETETFNLFIPSQSIERNNKLENLRKSEIIALSSQYFTDLKIKSLINPL